MNGVAKQFMTEVYAGVPVLDPRDGRRTVKRKRVKKLVRREVKA